MLQKMRRQDTDLPPVPQTKEPSASVINDTWRRAFMAVHKLFRRVGETLTTVVFCCLHFSFHLD